MIESPHGKLPGGATTEIGTATQRHSDADPGRSTVARIAVSFCALAAIIVFIVLGTWQVQRLSWKLDLIQRTEQRVHATPVSAPEPAAWSSVSASNDAYRHVRLTGVYLPQQSVRVQAVTDFGAGFWLLTPLRQANGAIVLINQGFVLAQRGPNGSNQAVCDDAATLANQSHLSTTITGLLRLSEPGGAFLRHNDPLAQRWYSRDVQAIARQQQLGQIAPYFIDIDGATNADGTPAQPNRQPSMHCPLGGLTVVSFQNNHLVYAVTWYALALMVAGAFGWAARSQRRATAGAINHSN